MRHAVTSPNLRPRRSMIIAGAVCLLTAAGCAAPVGQQFAGLRVGHATLSEDDTTFLLGVCRIGGADARDPWNAERRHGYVVFVSEARVVEAKLALEYCGPAVTWEMWFTPDTLRDYRDVDRKIREDSQALPPGSPIIWAVATRSGVDPNAWALLAILSQRWPFAQPPDSLLVVVDGDPTTWHELWESIEGLPPDAEIRIRDRDSRPIPRVFRE